MPHTKEHQLSHKTKVYLEYNGWKFIEHNVWRDPIRGKVFTTQDALGVQHARSSQAYAQAMIEDRIRNYLKNLNIPIKNSDPLQSLLDHHAEVLQLLWESKAMSPGALA